jgi:hypothetical protein
MKTENQLVPTYSQFLSKESSKAIYQLEAEHGTFNLSWYYTDHFRQRASQRGLSYTDALKVIEFGEPIFKQGFVFYVVTKRAYPDSEDQADLQHLNNWVVVVAEHARLVTCYKCKNGLKHLKQKQSRLSRRSKCI